jgi:hypothetical protein
MIFMTFMERGAGLLSQKLTQKGDGVGLHATFRNKSIRIIAKCATVLPCHKESIGV